MKTPMAELKVSGESFRLAFEREHSYDTLASAVRSKLATKAYRKRNAPQTCSGELIGQLVRGQTKRTHYERAAAIEEVLGRQRELFRLDLPEESPTRPRVIQRRAA